MPTALELGPENWAPYIKASRLRQRPIRKTAADAALEDRLRRRVRETAAVLKTRFGARRVVLFGSLVHGGWFGPHSDVDLAIEGLTAKAFWDAWRTAEEAIGERAVDLVEIENAREPVRRAIERHGIEL